MGNHLKVLRKSYPMNTNMTGFVFFPKTLSPCALDPSRPINIGRVKVLLVDSPWPPWLSFEQAPLFCLFSRLQKDKFYVKLSAHTYSFFTPKAGCNIGSKALVAKRGKVPIDFTCPAGTSTCPATQLNKRWVSLWGLSPNFILSTSGKFGFCSACPIAIFCQIHLQAVMLYAV